ncbi:MAG: hypothetical protein IJI35_05610, partial [Kiritimatiellae bacterium]|nr:hypothetical protein [Kiritimatiellia bacterium]
ASADVGGERPQFVGKGRCAEVLAVGHPFTSILSFFRMTGSTAISPTTRCLSRSRTPYSGQTNSLGIHTS